MRAKKPGRRLPIFLFFLAFFVLPGGLAAAPPLKGKRVALVIGNGSYNIEGLGLQQARNDAIAVANILKKLGFAEENIVRGLDLTAEQTFAKIAEFQDKLRPGDEALFFFAGHGVSVAGDSYLLAVDTPSQIDLSEQRREKAAISMNDIVESLGKARVAFIFLDACRTSAPEKRFSLAARSANGRVEIVQGVSRSNASANIATKFYWVYSTQPNNVALELPGQRNSPFTAALVKHIATRGLTIQKIVSKVAGEVAAATKNRQRPWVEETLYEDFWFLPPAPKPPGGLSGVEKAAPHQPITPAFKPPPGLHAGFGAG